MTLQLNFNLEGDILILPKCNENELEQKNSLSQFFSYLNHRQFQRAVGKQVNNIYIFFQLRFKSFS